MEPERGFVHVTPGSIYFGYQVQGLPQRRLLQVPEKEFIPECQRRKGHPGCQTIQAFYDSDWRSLLHYVPFPPGFIQNGADKEVSPLRWSKDVFLLRSSLQSISSPPTLITPPFYVVARASGRFALPSHWPGLGFWSWAEVHCRLLLIKHLPDPEANGRPLYGRFARGSRDRFVKRWRIDWLLSPRVCAGILLTVWGTVLKNTIPRAFLVTMRLASLSFMRANREKCNGFTLWSISEQVLKQDVRNGREKPRDQAWWKATSFCF